jgi:hypothetical protein
VRPPPSADPRDHAPRDLPTARVCRTDPFQLRPGTRVHGPRGASGEVSRAGPDIGLGKGSRVGQPKSRHKAEPIRPHRKSEPAPTRRQVSPIGSRGSGAPSWCPAVRKWLSSRLGGRNLDVDRTLRPFLHFVASSWFRSRRKAEGFCLASCYLLLSLDASGEAGDTDRPLRKVVRGGAERGWCRRRLDRRCGRPAVPGDARERGGRGGEAPA